MAPASRYRPPLVPYSKSESEQGTAALQRQRVYNQTHDATRVPLAMLKPAEAPAAGGARAAPKIPPEAKPEPA
eukprot:4019173-Alexandrium_andersonii.AAC.1